MKFTKMQAFGNDYVYIDAIHQKLNNLPELARFVSDRHFAIGSIRTDIGNQSVFHRRIRGTSVCACSTRTEARARCVATHCEASVNMYTITG